MQGATPACCAVFLTHQGVAMLLPDLCCTLHVHAQPKQAAQYDCLDRRPIPYQQTSSYADAYEFLLKGRNNAHPA